MDVVFAHSLKTQISVSEMSFCCDGWLWQITLASIQLFCCIDYQQMFLFGQIQISQTEGQLYCNTSPYKESECSLVEDKSFSCFRCLISLQALNMNKGARHPFTEFEPKENCPLRSDSLKSFKPLPKELLTDRVRGRRVVGVYAQKVRLVVEAERKLKLKINFAP